MDKHSTKDVDTKKRPVIRSIRTDLHGEAKALNLTNSRAAEAAIEAAVNKAKGEAWLRENKAAIDGHNERIERDGTLIKPIWLQD